MIKFVTKVADKLLVPIVVLNLAVIGSVFYKQGKLDAAKEIEAVNAANEAVEA